LEYVQQCRFSFYNTNFLFNPNTYTYTNSAIAIAVAAGAAAGITVAVLMNAKSALLKLEAVLDDLHKSKTATCVLMRQMAFRTKTFQVATRAFAKSVKIIVPPQVRTSHRDNSASEFLRKTGLRTEPDTSGNAAKLQGYLDVLLNSLESHSEQVIKMMDRAMTVSCSQYTSRYEKSLYKEIYTQHREVKKLTRQLIFDVITFVIAAVGAGLGVAADVATKSATKIVRVRYT